MTEADLRGCPKCKRSVRVSLKFCPHCDFPLRVRFGLTIEVTGEKRLVEYDGPFLIDADDDTIREYVGEPADDETHE